MADVEDGDPREEVEVLVALGVPQAAARAAHELHRITGVSRDRVGALERLEFGERHSVRPSRRSSWPWPGVGEELRGAASEGHAHRRCERKRRRRGSPPGRPASFGPHPAGDRPAAPSRTLARASASEMTLAGSPGPSHPATSVRNMILYAPSARATAPAASSALMLYDVALAVGADARDHRDVVLGDVRAARSTSTRSIRPTKPMSWPLGRGLARDAETAARRRRTGRPPAARGG